MAGQVLVIGSTGKVGSELVKLLSASGTPTRAATRRPSAAAAQTAPNVTPVAFDFEHPETFSPALAGVEKVFLIARPGDNESDRAAIPFIDEARKAHVRLLVNLTAMGVEQDEGFMLRRLERYLEGSSIPWTHLRPNWFMQVFTSGPMLADIRATGALHLPAADATISFVDVRDIAAVAFAALMDDRHCRQAYTLTGGEALSHQQVVEKLSAASGRRISYIPLSEEAARAALAKGGVPAGLIERWTDFYRKIRQGACSPVSPDVERILGRPPIQFDQFARENAETWRS